MDLEQMLALLPDNDSGQIGASDMRDIVTNLWEYTQSVHDDLNAGAVATGQAINALDERVTALEETP